MAALLAVSTATVRRWRARHERGERLVARRGRAAGSQANRETAELVEAVVRASNGLVGAESLRRTVPGVSRRQAAVIKHRTLTTMENERIAALSRVVVTTPGVVRGFDGMHVATTGRPWWLLTSADAALPYRTSITLTEAYDTAAVVAALEHDVARHGAPLVYGSTGRRPTRRTRSTSCSTRTGSSCSTGRRGFRATTGSSSGRTASTVPGSTPSGCSTPTRWLRPAPTCSRR